MIWQNPLAWLGLAAIAVPIVIHLLGRTTARRQRFPTLRFVVASKQTPVRRDRVTDLAVLVVRAGVLAAAVAGLAQPLFLAAARTPDDRAVARAIVVDTSASMTRTGAGGGSALDAARREAEALASIPGTSRVVMSAAPGEALEGAVAWLTSQPGRRELVIVSDFQISAIDPRDLTRVPAGVGVEFTRVEAGAWPARPAAAPGVLLIAASEDRARADAAWRAALALAAPATSRADRPVAVVFQRADEYGTILDRAAPFDQPWMFDVASAVAHDPLLADAVVADKDTPFGAVESSRLPALIPLVRTPDGRPVVFATRGRVRGENGLLFLPVTDAGSRVSAALLVAAARAVTDVPAPAELDTRTRTDQELQSWQRDAAPATTNADSGGRSDGRWLWGIALLLLGLEAWMRRARVLATEPERAR